MRLASMDEMLRESRWTGVLCLLAVAVAAGLYVQAGLFGYCDLDDPMYVAANPLIKAGLSWSTAARAFAPDPAMYWSPLTVLSFLLDRQLFGHWAGWYHLTNVFWHCANVALFFFLVLRLSGSRFAAVFAALLLAAHPAHVEAVAWISARKDVLSTFWGLATIHIYISWARRPGPWLAVGLYAAYCLSLMAKPMFVTLPALLLVLDYWPLARLQAQGSLWPDRRRLVACAREKVLLLALGLFITYMTLTSHYEGYDSLDPNLGLKIANALSAYAKYLGLLLWPHDQALVYPFPSSVPLAHSLGGAALLACVTGLCLWQARGRGYLLTGWLWFLGTLVPVIMPPKVGLHLELADRWTYVPFLGLYLALGALAAELLSRIRRPALRWSVGAAVTVAALTPLGLAQQRYLATWATPDSIYEQALGVTTGSHLLWNNFGGLKMNRGDKAGAELCYLKALETYPGWYQPLFNLGLMRMEQGRYAEALDYLWEAKESEEKMGRGYDQYRALAHCLVKLGKNDEAQSFFARAIKASPGRFEAYLDWGNLVKGLGDKELAKAMFEKALEADPDNFAASISLKALEREGKKP